MCPCVTSHVSQVAQNCVCSITSGRVEYIMEIEMSQILHSHCIHGIVMHVSQNSMQHCCISMVHMKGESISLYSIHGSYEGGVNFPWESISHATALIIIKRLITNWSIVSLFVPPCEENVIWDLFQSLYNQDDVYFRLLLSINTTIAF